jgi:hypothetical protein
MASPRKRVTHTTEDYKAATEGDVTIEPYNGTNVRYGAEGSTRAQAGALNVRRAGLKSNKITIKVEKDHTPAIPGEDSPREVLFSFPGECHKEASCECSCVGCVGNDMCDCVVWFVCLFLFVCLFVCFCLFVCLAAKNLVECVVPAAALL